MDPVPAAILSAFASYALEKKRSKHPEEFGRGAVEGVAGPESANNSATAGSMVPLLALGIPFAPPTALLLGALTIHGVQPGPLLMSKHPEVFWGVVASMYIGNAVLLIFDSLWACFEVAHNDIDGLHLVLLSLSQNVVPKK